ncbi:ABC transporter permease [Nocardia otitidiscaviarum]|uniref:ABC transporter permease n=1 Tax=Nocardia otitidiscaviarum TaxID=1823 RepID=A0A516NV32_9NOCA|nr:ABC transporter permease [Nocardia otitidiscaviarum]MCP9622206.1 ABC transporter permease [Nocardia otitidiscaviarum]QDP82776.1 ABC transporter permease [Nocardia otitidiscaviarum]
MNRTEPIDAAVRAGVQRGWIELRQSLTNGMDLFSMFFWPVLTLVALFFMRDSSYAATDLGLGSLALPGILGMLLAFNGIFGIAGYLSLEREDGTLLRAKATPNGMVGYLIGKILTTSGQVVAQVLLILVFGTMLVGGVELNSVGRWLTLLWVTALGLLATLPLGAILGSVFENPRSMGIMSLPIMGLVAISGIFYPITAMPDWVQGAAQVFPIYWLGLGMRSAMLPDDAVAVELAGSWRHWETAAVLGAWTVAGLLIAPIVLRRMARRESGANLAARREKALQRAY